MPAKSSPPVTLQDQLDALTKRMKMIEAMFDLDVEKGAGLGRLEKLHDLSPRARSILLAAGYGEPAVLAKRVDDPEAEYRAALAATGLRDTPELRKCAAGGRERRERRSHEPVHQHAHEMRALEKAIGRTDARIAEVRAGVEQLPALIEGLRRLEQGIRRPDEPASSAAVTFH